MATGGARAAKLIRVNPSDDERRTDGVTADLLDKVSVEAADVAASLTGSAATGELLERISAAASCVPSIAAVPKRLNHRLRILHVLSLLSEEALARAASGELMTASGFGRAAEHLIAAAKAAEAIGLRAARWREKKESGSAAAVAAAQQTSEDNTAASHENASIDASEDDEEYGESAAAQELIAFSTRTRFDLALYLMTQAHDDAPRLSRPRRQAESSASERLQLSRWVQPVTSYPWAIHADGMVGGAGISSVSVRTAWRQVTVLLRHFREIEHYTPDVLRYAVHVYLRFCVAVSVGDFEDAPPGGGGGFPIFDEGKRTVFPASARGGMLCLWGGGGGGGKLHDLIVFYKSRRGDRVRLPKKRMLREAETVFRHIFGELEPRASMREVSYADELRRWMPETGDVAALADWAARIADGVLTDAIKDEYTRRLYASQLEPAERERFGREKLMLRRDAYNIIAQYRPETLNLLVDWLEWCYNPPMYLMKQLKRRMHNRQKAGRRSGGASAPAEEDDDDDDDDDDGAQLQASSSPEKEPMLPLRYLAEQLALEVTFKYAFDMALGVNSLVGWIFERHRRHEATDARRPMLPSAKWRRHPRCLIVVQLVNRYEIVERRWDSYGRVYTYAVMPDVGGASENLKDSCHLAACFLYWLRWYCEREPLAPNDYDEPAPAFFDLYVEVFGRYPPEKPARPAHVVATMPEPPMPRASQSHIAKRTKHASLMF